MIIAFIYFLVIVFIIYKNGFFGIFKDDRLSTLKFSALFILKCLAVPVFYYIFKKYYGGIEQYDAGGFFRDSKTINELAYSNFTEFFKLMIGIQDESEGSFLFNNYITRTNNWDEGMSSRLIFNDNRTVIRIHALIHFISFNSYYVHALFSCLLSFIGISLIYKSFKFYFLGKELLFIAPFILLPNLWLFTGALLKEPIIILLIGVNFYMINKFIIRKSTSVLAWLYLIPIVFFSIILKPQVLVVVSGLYLVYSLAKNVKFPILYFSGGVILITVIANLSILQFKNANLFDYVGKKQNEFTDLMKGGYFLKDKTKFVRVEYDSKNITRILINNQEMYKINYNVPFYYWEDSHQKDSMYCASNRDTVTLYKLIYKIVPAKSGYAIGKPELSINGIKQTAKALYYAIIYPISFNSFLNSIVSIENLFLFICLLTSLIGLFIKKEKLIILFFITVFLSLILLFGFTTPNTGAIVRYRSIVTPFIVLAAFYTLAKNEPKSTS